MGKAAMLVLCALLAVAVGLAQESGSAPGE